MDSVGVEVNFYFFKYRNRMGKMVRSRYRLEYDEIVKQFGEQGIPFEVLQDGMEARRIGGPPSHTSDFLRG